MGDVALVTGGAGFIGSQLVRDLRMKGVTVLVLDNFCFGREKNLEGLDGVEILREDLRKIDPRQLRKLLRRRGVGRVFHLAALHFIPYCETHASETIAVNIEGTRRLLESLEGTDVRSIVFASTGDVYGFSCRRLTEASLIQPFNVYGYSKLCGEYLLQMMQQRIAGSRIAVARLFNTYGPRETNPHLIPHIVDDIERGHTVKLGSLTPRRDYIFVQDVSQALIRLSGVRSPYTVCNVCRGEAFSVAAVVDTMARILCRPLRVRSMRGRIRKIERPVLIGDNSRLRAVTGWAPQVSLATGLRCLLENEGLVQTGPQPVEESQKELS